VLSLLPVQLHSYTESHFLSETGLAQLSWLVTWFSSHTHAEPVYSRGTGHDFPYPLQHRPTTCSLYILNELIISLMLSIQMAVVGYGLSVYPHDISRTAAARITKLDREMFYHGSWSPLFWGRRSQGTRSSVNVGFCTLVSAGFFWLLLCFVTRIVEQRWGCCK